MDAYQPLYLKYRPQTLLDLVGQSSVTQTLKNAIDHDRISHAYLFTGPRGTGKTSSARILAKSLNCETGMNASPCLKCTSCLEVKQCNSPAVFEIDAASNNSVDDARLLIERAPLVSQGGRFKLYIIDECHMLTKEAFNALLKTIEEPPPKVIFILATTEEHKVPQTIVSRCQRLMFRLVNQKELVVHLRKIAQLENVEVEEEALELIARRSGGGLRDALGLLDQACLLFEPGKPVGVTDLLTMLGAVHEDVLLQISHGVLHHDAETVLKAAHSLMMEGREPALLAIELAKHFLNLAKASYLATGKTSAGEAQSLILGSANYIKALVEQAPSFERAELAQIVERLDSLEQDCRRSSQPALNLEIGLVALCHRQDIMLLRELSSRVDQLEAELYDGAKPPSKQRPAGAGTASPPPSTRPVGAGMGAPPASTPPRPSYEAPPPSRPTSAPAPHAPSPTPALATAQPAAPAVSVPAPTVSAPPVMPAPAVGPTPSVSPAPLAPAAIAMASQNAVPSPAATASQTVDSPLAGAATQSSSPAAVATLAEPSTALHSSAEPTAPKELTESPLPTVSNPPTVAQTSNPTSASQLSLMPAPAVHPELADAAMTASSMATPETEDTGASLPANAETNAAVENAISTSNGAPPPDVDDEEEPAYNEPDDEDEEDTNGGRTSVAPVISKAEESSALAAGTGLATTDSAASVAAIATTSVPIVPDIDSGAEAAPQFEQPGSRIELEEIWSNLLDELQRRHLPTFSLVSSQGFPVAIEKDDLTIGVKAEHLQKMLENKSDHIKAAFTSAMGRPMTVRVRVVGQAAPARTPARDRGKKTPPDDAAEDGPAAHSSASPERTSSGRSATAIADHVRTQVEQTAPPATMPGPQPKLTPAAPTPSPGGARQIDASLVDQAYKLFEGPGSRRIT